MDFLKIKKIDLYNYNIPLIYPVTIHSYTINNRTGYIIRLITESGLAGYGDIAPLPGLHTESSDEIPEVFSKMKKSLLGYEFNADSFLQGSEFLESDFPPSLRFGIESAMLSLIDLGLSKPDRKYFFTDLVPEVKLNALIDPAELHPEKALSKILKNGFTCIKIKTGRQLLENDIRMIRRIDELTGESILLRIDSNRLWSLEEAVEFCRQIPLRKIEYLEEPVHKTGALADLYKLVPVPLAVDESLMEYETEKLLRQVWLNAAIVKPAVFGGVFKTLELMHQAELLDRKVVISDTYHSGVGTAMLTRIAAIRRRHMPAAGLDTYSRLKKDVINKPLLFKKGMINLRDTQTRSRQINFNILSHDEAA